MRRVRVAFKLAAALILPILGGCSHAPIGTTTAELSDRDCLARAMYFESLRSSEEGMMAVGTTVMNRLDNPKFPKTVCGVVGQPHQYAPGALTSEVKGKSWARAQHVADEVLSGARHPQVGTAMYFHTVGWHYPYHDAHYVVVAGGNAFYEKVAPQYQHFVPNIAPEQPSHFEAPPTREVQFARAEPRLRARTPVDRVEVAESDPEDGAPRADPAAEAGPPRPPPYARAQRPTELAEAESFEAPVMRETSRRRMPPAADRDPSFEDEAPRPRRPARAAAFAGAPARARTIDDILAASTSLHPDRNRLSVAKLAPVQIHPYTD